MNNSSNLLNVLKGCLHHQTINQSEATLKQLSQQNDFLSQLLALIPNQQSQLLLLILSTIKQYMLVKYNDLQAPISQDQKQIFKDNIFNFYYEICHNEQAVNLYKQLINIVISVDYPWNNLDNLINEDLNGSIVASCYFFRQLAKVYEYFTGEQRFPLEKFINDYFPKIQNLVQKILSNFTPDTAKVLEQILKTFYSCCHIDIPHYLRNYDNISRWFLYLKTILQATLENNILNQRHASRIFTKIASMYFNDNSDGKQFKGWSHGLRQRHAVEFLQIVLGCLANPNGDQSTAQNIMSCLIDYCRNATLRCLLTEQNCNFIIYNQLLPNIQSNQQDLNVFKNDPFQYIRSDEDLTFQTFKRTAMDLIQYILNYCSFNNKSQLMKFIQFSSGALTSNASDRQKQVIIRILTKLSTIIKKNKFIKQQFENLSINYFIPLLKVNSPLLNSQVCRLFAAYLNDVELSDSTVTDLMGLLYQKMVGNSDVLKYNAILAFTSLLKHQAALSAAKQHFQNILQIYVKMLEIFDHQNLLKCLQSIVSNFSTQIITYAPNLISHLLGMFFSFCKNNTQQNQDPDQDQEDSNKQASAALSTIEQILKCPLQDNIYLKVSQDIIDLFRQIFDELDQYFQEILSLFNVLVYKAKVIVNFQFPYVACRKLLEGNNNILNGANFEQQLINTIHKAQKADEQYGQILISILKNLIQKMPENILYKYYLPTNAELILCLIQNKKIQPNELANLNTCEVDQNWSQILQSYSFIVYGTGQVTNPKNFKMVTGVSLYPWLKQSFGVDIVKKVLNTLQQQQQDDEQDLLQENTMQLLQKYADQQQQEDDFYISSGINYAFLYNSPFDSSKDRQFLMSQLKFLSNQNANALMSSLTNKQRKRIQILFG